MLLLAEGDEVPLLSLLLLPTLLEVLSALVTISLSSSLSSSDEQDEELQELLRELLLRLLPLPLLEKELELPSIATAPFGAPSKG